MVKLSDVLRNLGRPVVIHPRLSRIVGGTKANILLSQFIYWTGKQTDPDGWIYKQSEELEDETGLSYKEQVRARAALSTLRILEERNDRLNHRMYYRINFDTLNALWERVFNQIPKLPLGSSGNALRSVGESTFGSSVKDKSLQQEITNTAQAGKAENALPETSCAADELSTGKRDMKGEEFKLEPNGEEGQQTEKASTPTPPHGRLTDAQVDSLHWQLVIALGQIRERPVKIIPLSGGARRNLRALAKAYTLEQIREAMRNWYSHCKGTEYEGIGTPSYFYANKGEKIQMWYEKGSKGAAQPKTDFRGAPIQAPGDKSFLGGEK